MARPKLGGGSKAKQGSEKKSGPNPYVGGLWVKEDGDKQLLSYIVKSEEDKQKLKAHLEASIESGESFILYGIENSYREGNSKAPHYVLLIPSKKD